ncbi:hypothetical protein BDV3_001419 [Batrachochytrium dendrobatidis]|nr:hypothetical protein O5D80_004227 [Batrachochytrium dendrobatidis]KAK5668418.1 hypothetical protein QVD99_005437 [Batrachochytrium dendrobatidis]
MAGLFGWLSKKEDTNYEKILLELDDKIRRSEMRLAEFGLRERRLLYAWFFYTLPAYIIVLAVYAMYYRMSDGEPWKQFLIKSLPVVVVPIIIYLVRAGIIAWYLRCRNVEEIRLDELRTKQNDKITELKLKTSFYLTKGLIERYDNPKSKGGKQRKGSENPSGHDQTSSGSRHHPQANRQPQSADSRSEKTQESHGQRPHTQMSPQRRASPSVSENGPHSRQMLSNHPGFQQMDNAQHTPLQRQQLLHQQHIRNNDQLTPSHVVHQQQQMAALPASVNWFDSLLEAIIGESDGPQHKYALICEKCFTHNGLVLPNEYLVSRFKCMQCGHFNAKKTSAYAFDFNHSAEQSSHTFNSPSPPSSPVSRLRRRSNSICSNTSDASFSPMHYDNGSRSQFQTSSVENLTEEQRSDAGTNENMTLQQHEETVGNNDTASEKHDSLDSNELPTKDVSSNQDALSDTSSV